MYSYKRRLVFIYTSIYESLAEEAEPLNSIYWRSVLQKLDPRNQAFDGGECDTWCALAFLNGYFYRSGCCDAGWLLKYVSPAEMRAWRRHFRHVIGKSLSLREKRDLLRMLTTSPAVQVF